MGDNAYQELKKKKNEPRTCDQALKPPLGGGLTSETAAAPFSAVPSAESKVEGGDSAARSSSPLCPSSGTTVPAIFRQHDQGRMPSKAKKGSGKIAMECRQDPKH